MGTDDECARSRVANLFVMRDRQRKGAASTFTAAKYAWTDGGEAEAKQQVSGGSGEAVDGVESVGRTQQVSGWSEGEIGRMEPLSRLESARKGGSADAGVDSGGEVVSWAAVGPAAREGGRPAGS